MLYDLCVPVMLYIILDLCGKCSLAVSEHSQFLVAITTAIQAHVTTCYINPATTLLRGLYNRGKKC